MNKRYPVLAGIIALFAMGTISAYGGLDVNEGDNQSTPRYSEECAHGHNGFDCDSSRYRVDITALQERIIELEDRVSQLERR